MNIDLFPTNLAIGKAFCNRNSQRKLLKQYLKHHRHVLITAPRRYGKTSLIKQTLIELKLPYTLMELTLATSAQDVEQLLIKHIGELLYPLLPKAAKAKQQLLKLFSWLKPELVLTAGGQKITFHPQPGSTSSANNLAELLTRLDQAATLVNKTVIVVMDEFQQLESIKGHAIEAAIRHTMQHSQRVSYVFSGSNRHLLLSMFNDKHRPFYNACEIMQLERISAKDYELFIQRAARQQWQRPLSDKVLNKILNTSERHASYVNRICGHFWLIDEIPNERTVEAYWYDFIAAKHAEFTADILRLSNNQKRLLRYLAHQPVVHPTAQRVSQTLAVPEASIRQSLTKLRQHDYVYKNQQGLFRLLDPAFKDFILSLSAKA